MRGNGFWLAVLCLATVAVPGPGAVRAAGQDDPRFGVWDCALPSMALGRLHLSARSYRLEGTAHMPSGQGAVSWTSDAFAVTGGPLERFTITSGLVFASPDPARPGVMVDLYAGPDASVHCVPASGA